MITQDPKWVEHFVISLQTLISGIWQKFPFLPYLPKPISLNPFLINLPHVAFPKLRPQKTPRHTGSCTDSTGIWGIFELLPSSDDPGKYPQRQGRAISGGVSEGAFCQNPRLYHQPRAGVNFPEWVTALGSVSTFSAVEARPRSADRIR